MRKDKTLSRAHGPICDLCGRPRKLIHKIMLNGKPISVCDKCFDVRIPNEMTLKAIQDSRKGKGEKLKNAQELFKGIKVQSC